MRIDGEERSYECQRLAADVPDVLRMFPMRNNQFNSPAYRQAVANRKELEQSNPPPVDLDHAIAWKESEGGERIFIQSSDGAESGNYLYDPEWGWRAVSSLGEGAWECTDYYQLDLRRPRSEFEKQWAAFLSPFDALQQISVEARKDEEGRLTVSSVRFRGLNLTFKAVKVGEVDQLESCEYPGFYLTTQRSLEALNGFQGALILENERSEQRVLVPAKRLKICKKSHAVHFQPEFDHRMIDRGPATYFAYQVDRKGEVRGEGVSANLFLTLIYRGQRDFIRAKRCLDLTFQHANNEVFDWEIVNQLGNQRDDSPQGVAFDCQVAYRMSVHENKWSQPNGMWEGGKEIPQIYRHLNEIFPKYRSAMSSYKEGVHAIPHFLRLSAAQQEQLSSKLTLEAWSSHALVSPELQEQIATRLKEIEIPLYFDYPAGRQITFAPEHGQKQVGERQPFVRTYSQEDNPGCDYLKQHFVSLFEDAVSGVPDRIKRARADLFFLVQNDVNYQFDTQKLAATLLYVLNHPLEFKNFGPYSDSSACYDALSKGILAKGSRRSRLFPVQPFLKRAPQHMNPRENKLLEGPQGLEYRPTRFWRDQRETVKEKTPLYDLSTKYFTSTEHPVAEGPFQLNTPMKASPLEKHLLSEYRKGHEENQKTNRKKFVFKPENTLEGLKDELTKQNTDDFGKLAKLEERLLALANKQPKVVSGALTPKAAQSLAQRTAQAGQQRSPITIGDVMMSFLKGRPKILADKNCFLTQERLDAVYSQFIECCLIQTRIHQRADALQRIEESEGDLDSYTQQRLGMILDKERTYSIAKYPLFLVYEYASGKMLLPEQKKALTWAIKKIISHAKGANEVLTHLLMQFAAGGGKTSVFIPILAQWLATLGCLPIIFNTSELYNVGIKDIPENLQASFKQHMEVLEAELDYVWTEEKIDKLLKDLKQWEHDEKVLLKKAVTWHAFLCSKKMAYAQGNPTLGAKIQQVLDFLYSEGVKLEDEGHLISDPLQQSIRTYGKMQSISVDCQTLFMKLYDCLLGRIEGCKELASLSGINDYSKKEISSKDLTTLREGLAKQLLLDPIFEGLDPQLLGNYFLQESKQRPDWLRQLEIEKKGLCDLVIAGRAFIHSHLPHILKMQHKKNYGQSMHPGDLTAAPKHDGTDTTAHFGDPLLVLALTIQLAEQEGVREEEMKAILLSFKKQHEVERKWCRKGQTPTEFFLASTLPDDLKGLSLDSLTPGQIDELAKDPRIFKHSEMIKKYLYEYALRQIEIPSQRFTSTPADMSRICQRNHLYGDTRTFGNVSCHD